MAGHFKEFRVKDSKAGALHAAGWRPFTYWLLVAVLWLPTIAAAELSVVISQGNDKATPIAVIPFSLMTAFAEKELQKIDNIIALDLTRSGQFKLLDVGSMLSFPTNMDEVYYRDWRVLGVQYLVFGTIEKDADGIFLVNFHLVDVLRGRLLFKDSAVGFLSDVRSVAHHVSDLIYEQVTGIPGIFSTQLLYVSVKARTRRRPKTYQLVISDSDGQSTQVVFESTDSIISPDWSPAGNEVAYVTFEHGWRMVVRHNIITNVRSFPIDTEYQSSAPAFSPDGSKLAVAIVRNDNTDIYVYDIKTTKLTRITTHYRSDTEPSWMPDGSGLIFTSDRSGGPQIYHKDLASGKVVRLTFEGNYNVDARVFPDGLRLAFLSRTRGHYAVATLDIASKHSRILGKSPYEDPPSVSPNGVMLIYSTKIAGRGVLAVTSLDGRMHYQLPDRFGNEVRHPVWAPFFSLKASTGG